MNQHHEQKDDTEEQGGEVSEVSSLDDAGEPISPEDSVTGAPAQGAGDDVDEGATGPNARTGNQDQEGDPR